MSNYATSLKASLDNLSDEEISKKQKTGYFSDEARVVAEQVLSEGGFASNESTKNVKELLGESNGSATSLLTHEQNNKFVQGNILVWMVGLFLFRVALFSKFKDIPALLLAQGILYSLIGIIIYLIYVQLKKKTWTTEELRKKYLGNFKAAMVVIGIAFISIFATIYFNVATLIAWIYLIVLPIILYCT